MMTSKELRAKAWASLKGKYWMAFVVVLVMGFLSSLGTGAVTTAEDMVNLVSMVDPSELDETMQIGALVITGSAGVIAIVGFLISTFVGSPATVGLCNYFIKNTDSKPTFGDAFSGFKVKYGRNVGTILLMSIKSVLWTFLFIIPGIIKMYEYAAIPYILADDDTITCKEAFAKSKQMMKGNKWRLFKLQFSFIGWGLLCVLTCGIGTFFLIPYVDAANAEFYVELKNK
ncbi:MAG: DUF975 family protein [Oscillospiraceae bacterium]|nr:DUF975 family protein [Oscillospiraceae bacterium]